MALVSKQLPVGALSFPRIVSLKAGPACILRICICARAGSQAVPVLGRQLVGQQELAAVELVQQQHLYTLRSLPLSTIQHVA